MTRGELIARERAADALLERWPRMFESRGGYREVVDIVLSAASAERKRQRGSPRVVPDGAHRSGLMRDYGGKYADWVFDDAG